ncbi:transposable element Tcb2 transposase [Trichonephila clavipes]|uniref:Transposable element Tcb2 transposase n=1 Tax=Trichonephila clavipes TaxID=2585209 RepID=A0A8X6VTQ4_TRICX|nr:transposable element Tcb2 transposase [Trichonephila clavipes]
MEPTCQQGTVQADGDSVMVWSVCSGRDMGPLIRLNTTLIGDRYVSILSGQLHQFTCPLCISTDFIRIHQDNVAHHTSGIATEWLQEYSSEFRQFHWPPKSPDMNIIGHIWNVLQSAVQKRSPPFLCPTDLWRALQDLWCQLPPKLFQTLIESMLHRVAARLCARGCPTRY